MAVAGDHIVTGAVGNAGAGTNAGSAYVYLLSSSSWTQQAKLTGTDTASWDYFGSSVAISGDYIVDGAKGDDSGA